MVSLLRLKGYGGQAGVRKIQRTAHRKQMTEDKEQTVSVFCHLTSVICYLTPRYFRGAASQTKMPDNKKATITRTKAA
jgi:hypothetical protein